MYLRPEAGSPTHTLPSLSGGDNEMDRGSEEGGFFSIQGEINTERTCHTKEVISKGQ